MGKEFVKQHFVPQSYLKRFAEHNDHNKGYHIGVRRKDKNGKIKLFEKAIDNIACGDNIYDVEELEDPKHYEHLFASEIEPLYGDLLSNIIAQITLGGLSKVTLVGDDRFALSKMICFQLSRVPVFIDRYMEKGPVISNKVKEFLLKGLGSSLNDEQKGKLTALSLSDDNIKNIILDMISSREDLEKFGGYINRGIFVFLYNDTDIPFFTSDNPVILYNYVKQNMNYEDNGIDNSETIIIFPLSPKILIEVVPQNYKIKGVECIDGKVVVLSNHNKEEILVEKVNYLQMDHAVAEAYMPPAYLSKINKK